VSCENETEKQIPHARRRRRDGVGMTCVGGGKNAGETPALQRRRKRNAGLKNPALRQAGRQYIESTAFRSSLRGSGKQGGWVSCGNETEKQIPHARRRRRDGVRDDMRGRGKNAGETPALQRHRKNGGSKEPCPAAGRPPVHRIDGLSKLPSRLGASRVDVLRERNGKSRSLMPVAGGATGLG